MKYNLSIVLGCTLLKQIRYYILKYASKTTTRKYHKIFRFFVSFSTHFRALGLRQI